MNDLPQNLPENTVALIKLPVPVSKLGSICELFPGPDMRIHQDGCWMVVTKGGKPS